MMRMLGYAVAAASLCVQVPMAFGAASVYGGAGYGPIVLHGYVGVDLTATNLYNDAPPSLHMDVLGTPDPQTLGCAIATTGSRACHFDVPSAVVFTNTDPAATGTPVDLFFQIWQVLPAGNPLGADPGDFAAFRSQVSFGGVTLSTFYVDTTNPDLGSFDWSGWALDDFAFNLPAPGQSVRFDAETVVDEFVSSGLGIFTAPFDFTTPLDLPEPSGLGILAFGSLALFGLARQAKL